jgi:hypothetical protein
MTGGADSQRTCVRLDFSCSASPADDEVADHNARRSGLGADVVNPDTVAYFSIMAGRHPDCGLPTRIDSITRGESAHLTTAYLVAALSAAHEKWLRAAQAHSGRLTG